MRKLILTILSIFLMASLALAGPQITGSGAGGDPMTYPGAGLPIAGSGAWDTSLTPLLGNLAQGVAGPVWGVSAFKVPTAVCGSGYILTSNGTDFICSVGFTVDADGDVVAKSLTITKTSGSAGDMGLYEANSTDVHGAGFRGPASITGDGAYRLMFPNARTTSANMVLSCTNGSESGTGTAADPYVQTCAWADLDNYVTKATAVTQCAVISAPADTDDLPIFKAPYALTIVAGSIHVYVIGGTNVVGGLDECTGTAGVCSGVTAVDADITGTAGNDVADDGSLTNAGIASGNWIMWHTTSVSGSPTSVSVCFSYTID